MIRTSIQKLLRYFPQIKSIGVSALTILEKAKEDRPVVGTVSIVVTLPPAMTDEEKADLQSVYPYALVNNQNTAVLRDVEITDFEGLMEHVEDGDVKQYAKTGNNTPFGLLPSTMIGIICVEKLLTRRNYELILENDFRLMDTAHPNIYYIENYGFVYSNEKTKEQIETDIEEIRGLVRGALSGMFEWITNNISDNQLKNISIGFGPTTNYPAHIFHVASVVERPVIYQLQPDVNDDIIIIENDGYITLRIDGDIIDRTSNDCVEILVRLYNYYMEHLIANG